MYSAEVVELLVGPLLSTTQSATLLYDNPERILTNAFNNVQLQVKLPPILISWSRLFVKT